jgi:hypothetical protein
MPTVPFHREQSDIELIDLTENVVASVANRPLKRLWESTLHNKEVWEEWLADPVLENSLQINADLNMTGDIGVGGNATFGGYGDFGDYIDADGHIRSRSYIQADGNLTVFGESTFKTGFSSEDNGDIITPGEQYTFTEGNSGAGGNYGLFLQTTGGDAGGLLVKTGDDNNDEFGFSLYNHNDDPVFEITGTEGDTTLGPQAQLFKYDSGGVKYQILDNDAKISRAVYNDLAEFMPKNEDVEPGDVLIWEDGGVKACREGSDERVMGVYSDSYGIYIGGNNVSEEENLKDFAPQGLCGRVQVKAVGPIEELDLLESSNTKGYARKSEEKSPGTVIGKALENLAAGEKKRIWMFIQNC